jgi:hypothetical protein
MPLNPYFRMRNAFNIPDDTTGGFDSGPMQNAFSSLDQTPDDYGFNQRMMQRAMTPAFSNYQVDTPNDINQRQSQLKQYEQGPSTSAYLDYANANKAPNRDDFQPSKMRTFLAALAGGTVGWNNPAAGIKIGADVRDNPYNQARDDYEAKLKSLHDAAQIESQNKNYEAMSGYRNYGAETGGFRQAETARSNRAKEGIASNWNLARVDQFGKTNAQKEAELNETKSYHGITTKETGRHNVAEEGIGNRNAASGEVRARAATTGAAAASKNADTNAAREGVYSRDVDSRIDDRKNKPRVGTKGPSPAEIDKATKAAAAQLRANNSEEYGDFADKYGNATPPTGFFGGATSNPKFKKFNDDVKALSEQMLKQKYPGYTHSKPTAPAVAAPANSDAVDGSVDY